MMAKRDVCVIGVGMTKFERCERDFTDLVREAVASGDGRVIKQIGDEFMLVFPSAADAVSCGIDILTRIGREPRFPAVRLGAHSGTALFREADYLGATVNIAARVVDEATRGEFLITGVTRTAVGDLHGVSFAAAGSRNLKGVAEPVALFSMRRAGQEDMTVTDPVCGMELRSEQRDIRVPRPEGYVYFCSEPCKARFTEAPERYMPDA